MNLLFIIATRSMRSRISGDAEQARFPGKPRPPRLKVTYCGEVLQLIRVTVGVTVGATTLMSL
jgi:hypothetical protein